MGLRTADGGHGAGRGRGAPGPSFSQATACRGETTAARQISNSSPSKPRRANVFKRIRAYMFPYVCTRLRVGLYKRTLNFGTAKFGSQLRKMAFSNCNCEMQKLPPRATPMTSLWSSKLRCGAFNSLCALQRSPCGALRSGRAPTWPVALLCGAFNFLPVCLG